LPVVCSPSHFRRRISKPVVVILLGILNLRSQEPVLEKGKFVLRRIHVDLICNLVNAERSEIVGRVGQRLLPGLTAHAKFPKGILLAWERQMVAGNRFLKVSRVSPISGSKWRVLVVVGLDLKSRAFVKTRFSEGLKISSLKN